MALTQQDQLSQSIADQVLTTPATMVASPSISSPSVWFALCSSPASVGGGGGSIGGPVLSELRLPASQMSIEEGVCREGSGEDDDNMEPSIDRSSPCSMYASTGNYSEAARSSSSCNCSSSEYGCQSSSDSPTADETRHTAHSIDYAE